MKLINLTLTNFKGVKQFALDTNGESVSIFGDNATGKTTLADAQCWLLFDKDSKGTKNFSPKTKDENGQDLHNIENVAFGVYQLDDGSTVSFKKAFSEIWKKKRGMATPEFSGHTTDYYIDGVPVKANEYADRVNLLPQQTLLALSSPTYFAEELPIAQRREMLMEIVGDITDDEVIGSNEDLSELKSLLDNHSVEDFLKISKARLTEINKDLNSMPTRIDEATKAMPETVNVEDINAEIVLLTAEKQKLSDSLNASQGEKLAEIRTKIAELKAKLLEGENAHKQKYDDANAKISEQIRGVQSRLNVAKATADSLYSDTSRQGLKINELKIDRENLLTKYTETSKKVWAGDTICPTCNQNLPEGDVAKAQEQFNLNKSNALLILNKQGKENCSKEIIAAEQAKLDDLRARLDAENKKIEACKAEIIELEINMQVAPPYQNKEIDGEIIRLQGEMEQIKATENANNSTVNEQIGEINVKLSDCSDKKSSTKLAEAQKTRIEELEKQQKQLGVEYEKTTKGIYLCEQFTRAKVSMLTDNINSRFENVKFRLFTEQINGGLKEDCEPLVPSVNGLIPFAYANNAARINAGLDIIKVLSEHYKTSMPVFVDNAESVTSLNGDGLQVVRLVVSDDKKLRVEGEK